MAKAKKELDSELNLIAFISLLSVLICSLLLTAIWVQIGSMNVKQAVGGQSQTTDKKTPSLWASLNPDGSIRFQLQDVAQKARKLNGKSIKGLEGDIDRDAVNEYILQLKKLAPELKTVLIQPKADTVYEDIIVLMDQFKKEGMIDLGVTPL